MVYDVLRCMSVAKDHYFAALCMQDKNFAICGKLNFPKQMPQKQEQLRVLRNPLDVTAFFISKHFISGERRLLRFQMSHPGQCGWPQILTIVLLELSTRTDPAKIFTLSSHRRPCLLLKKQLRTELKFFLLFIKSSIYR